MSVYNYEAELANSVQNIRANIDYIEKCSMVGDRKKEILERIDEEIKDLDMALRMLKLNGDDDRIQKILGSNRFLRSRWNLIEVAESGRDSVPGMRGDRLTVGMSV